MRVRVVGIVGITGSGKTFLTKRIIKKIKRLIVLDPKSEFEELPNIDNFDDFLDKTEEKDNFRFRVSLDDIEEYEPFFFALSDTRVDFLTELTLVVDEVSLFSSPFSENQDFRKIVQITGSKKNIDVIWNAQRPANVSRNLTSQSPLAISFRVEESADTRYFKRKWRKPDGEIILGTLETGHFRIVRGTTTELNTLLKQTSSLLSVMRTLPKGMSLTQQIE